MKNIGNFSSYLWNPRSPIYQRRTSPSPSLLESLPYILFTLDHCFSFLYGFISFKQYSLSILLPLCIRNFFCVIDENECETGMASCEFPAKCRNTERSYECYCPHGTRGDHSTSHIVFCSDVNECHRKVCDKNSVKCTNTMGSFKCHCKEGFENSTPDSCRDIDECADPVIFLTVVLITFAVHIFSNPGS